jgi:hypothetical protein
MAILEAALDFTEGIGGLRTQLVVNRGFQHGLNNRLA